METKYHKVNSNNTRQKQNMVSGVGDLTFTGLVFSGFFNNQEKTGSRTGVTITCCTKLWPSYCTSSGVRITILM